MNILLQTFFPWNRSTKAPSKPTNGTLANTVFLWALLSLTYIITGRLVFAMTGTEASTNGFSFFPGGISLFFAIAFGYRVWPGIFVGQLALSLWGGLPTPAAGALASIASLQAIFGSFLFWRCDLARNMHGFRSVTTLFGLIAFLLQPLSATAAVFSLRQWAALPADNLLNTWYCWWAGHTLGQFLLVPLLLAWTYPAAQHHLVELRKAMLLVVIYLVLLVTFALNTSGPEAPLLRLVFIASFYLILVMLATQSGMRTITLANVLMATFYLWMIAKGTNFFLLAAISDRLATTCVLILAGTLTSFLVSTTWEELMERKEQLRESNAAKERLFSVIGHDLNGPVANLKSSLELLIEGRFSPAEFREFQQELLKGVNHVHDTLKNLMEWGGFQMESLQPRLDELALRASAAEALLLLDRIATEKKIRLENTIPAGAIVRADRHQIQSVIRNLLSNALKFTPSGGCIILSAQEENGFWRTSIRDTGVGMTPERTARLFNLQSEYVSTPGTANEPGLGLGLQICANFIRANHGDISVESQEGRGTTFHFTLPADAAVKSAPSPDF